MHDTATVAMMAARIEKLKKVVQECRKWVGDYCGGEDIESMHTRLKRIKEAVDTSMCDELLVGEDDPEDIPMFGTHICENCGKQTRNTTAGCDYCDYEDK
jgi:hypothetical protein